MIQKRIAFFLLAIAVPMVAFATPTAEEEVTLNLVMYGTEPQRYEALYDAYEAVNPNVTVDWELSNEPAYLLSRINAGDFPDAWMEGVISTINDMDDEGYLHDYSGDAFIDKMIPLTLEHTTRDGRVVGVPSGIQGYGMIYHKDLFEQAGITNVPLTLDELEAVCEQLVAAGITPFETGFGDSWIVRMIYSESIGAELPDDSILAISRGERTFADLDSTDGFFRLLRMMEEYSKGPVLDSFYNDQMTKMATGEAAMIHNGDWAEASIGDIATGVNIGFFATPVSDNPADAQLAVSPAAFWLTHKDGDNVDAVVDLIGWKLTEPEGMEFMSQTFNVPAIDGPVPDGPLRAEILRYVVEGRGRGWSWQNFWPNGWHDTVQRMSHEWLLGEKSDDEFLAALQASWDDLK